MRRNVSETEESNEASMHPSISAGRKRETQINKQTLSTVSSVQVSEKSPQSLSLHSHARHYTEAPPPSLSTDLLKSDFRVSLVFFVLRDSSCRLQQCSEGLCWLHYTKMFERASVLHIRQIPICVRKGDYQISLTPRPVSLSLHLKSKYSAL